MSFIFDALVEIYLTYMKPRIILWTMAAVLVAFILLVARLRLRAYRAAAGGLVWILGWLISAESGVLVPSSYPTFSGRQGQIANLARFSFWAFGAPRGNAALGDGLF